MSKLKNSKRDFQWREARKRYRLSELHVQMARELGMNPKKLGKLDNHKQEPWKLPLKEFISECYFKRFKREYPISSQNKSETKPQRKSLDATHQVSHSHDINFDDFHFF